MNRIWLKLTLVLIAVSISSILVATVLSIRNLDAHFEMYQHETAQKHDQEILSLLIDHYQKSGGWAEDSARLLADMASLFDLKIEWYDANRKLLGHFPETTAFDTSHNGNQPLLPIAVHDTVVGFLKIHHIHEQSEQSLEAHFQLAHMSAATRTMLILTVLACMVSIFLARRIVQPIMNVSKAALSAAEGNLSVRVPPLRSQDEIADLVKTFNVLVSTLERQEELRSRLTADIAHELRTPLNTLLAQIEGMIDGIWKATPEHLESTRLEVLRLIRLLQDLDQIIQTETGTLQMNLDVINLSMVIDQAVDAMVPYARQQQISIKRDIDPDMEMVGDSQRLSQVFTNLLSNSLKHTLSGGVISVSLKKNRHQIVAEVQDTGSGILQEDLPFVFERFYRGDVSRNRTTGGTGLGLTIVKSIVEAHKGAIHIQSKPGKGTRVTLRFDERTH